MKTYIIDLDGTMYSGSTNIDGAREFIDYLHSKNLPYIFLTNNATRTKKQAKEHMLNLGFKDIKEEDFYTSAMASAKFIAKNYPEKKCFMIGESGLEEALKEWNFDLVQENAIFVVVGLDRNATYKKYSEALHHILKGAKFIATNPDRLLANNGTFDIGNGAVIDMLEYASGVEAVTVITSWTPGFSERSKLKVSCPVNPRLSAFSPSINWTGKIPIITRFER